MLSVTLLPIRLDKPCLLFLLFLIVPVFGQAQFVNGVETIQVNDVGIVSYIDNSTNPACAGLAIQPNDLTSCFPHLEIIDMSQYENCITNSTLAKCRIELGIDFEYLVPYITESIAENILFDINKAYQDYSKDVIRIYNEELNRLPLCIDPVAVCPKVFDEQCVLQRITKAQSRIQTEAHPVYWAKVYQVILLHSPAALSYSVPYPLGEGMIFSPITANTPRLAQYYNKLVAPYASNVIDYARRLEWIAELPVPYIPSEISIDAGGIAAFEEDKRILDMGTIVEQERFGFANLFGIYNNTQEFGYHFDVLAGPYVPGFCWACTTPICFPMIPTPSIIPIPALVFPEPRARPRYVSVPEGESIPFIEGDPIPSPLN